MAVTVVVPSVKTGATIEGAGGARTSTLVPRIMAEADVASDTETPATVMAEPPAVIVWVPIAYTGTTGGGLDEADEEPDEEPKEEPADELVEEVLIATIGGSTAVLVLITAINEDNNCTEAGA